MELQDSVHSEIVRLGELGDALVDEKNYVGALAQFLEALRLLPSPKHDWEAANWLYAGIGDAHFFMEEWTDALNAFSEAARDVESAANPFLQMRLGQCHYEIDKHSSKALDYLCRAYMLDGREVFELERPYYLKLVKANLKLS